MAAGSHLPPVAFFRNLLCLPGSRVTVDRIRLIVCFMVFSFISSCFLTFGGYSNTLDITKLILDALFLRDILNIARLDIFIWLHNLC